ncbi:MAG: hypothetical protein WKG01_07775 [Kofleriaceae bacterium]
MSKAALANKAARVRGKKAAATFAEFVRTATATTGYDYDDIAEQVYLGLIYQTDFREWARPGLVKLVQALIEFAPPADARAMSKWIAEDLKSSRYYARHNHMPDDDIAQRDCAVCLARKRAA